MKSTPEGRRHNAAPALRRRSAMLPGIRRNGAVLRAHTTIMEKELQIVGFRIGRETFGLPIAMVREIVRVPEITSVPNAPDYIEGVINLRGTNYSGRGFAETIRREIIGAKQEKPHCGGRAGSAAIGLIVNSASEVLRIPPSEIEEPHNVFQEGELDLHHGRGKTERAAGDSARSEPDSAARRTARLDEAAEAAAARTAWRGTAHPVDAVFGLEAHEPRGHVHRGQRDVQERCLHSRRRFRSPMPN